jgi:hypothetical protein
MTAAATGVRKGGLRKRLMSWVLLVTGCHAGYHAGHPCCARHAGARAMSGGETVSGRRVSEGG